MKISAIIAEYNPLHKGHLYQINKTKELTGCNGLIALMSGNFVQRGEPALIDKWTRAKIALENGIDLVLELPVTYSLSSAEFFAYGSISILDRIGVVNSICFGSEIGDIDILLRIARILVDEPAEYKEYLKSFLTKGFNYPDSRARALMTYINENNLLLSIDLQSILNSSNNILGLEYCKSLIKSSSKIKPYTIKREGGTYNSIELDERYSSATAIRKLIEKNKPIDTIKNQLPEKTHEIIEKLLNSHYDFTFSNSMFPFIKYKCLFYPDGIGKLPDASEGLHNRIYNSILYSTDYWDIISRAKTKRYTYTRISRILSQFFIGFEQFDTCLLRSSQPTYVRVLGFNGIGKEILKMMKSKSELDIFTKLPSSSEDMLRLDIQSTKMYSLLNRNINFNQDYLTSPIIYK